MSKSGIYIIQSLSKPERVYVGSATNLATRRATHKTQLRQGIHDNPKLQRHVDKYGLSDLAFDVVESNVYIDRNYLLAREQMWFSKFAFNGENIPYFNLCPIAGCNIGVTYSAESKKRMSEAMTGRVITDEARGKISKTLKGRKHSQEASANQSKGQNKAVYQFDINGVFIREWESLKIAGETLGIVRTNISACVNHSKVYNQAGGFIWRFKSEIIKPRNLENNEIGNVHNKNSKKPIMQLSRDNYFVAEWESIRYAARSLSIGDTEIGFCCRGIRKTAGGFKWKYKNIA